MHAELIEQLRCPRPHEESWLVAVATRVEDRDLLAGTLGCPVCRAEFPIVDGVVRFAEPLAPGGAVPPARAEAAMRLAALLDLTDPRATALLLGAPGALAGELRSVSPARLLLIDRPAEVSPGGGVFAMDAGSLVPLAPNSMHAAAVDAAHAGAMEAVVRAVRPGGRIVAPVEVPVPPNVRELARDELDWVGAREAEAVVVPLGVKRRGN